MLGVRLICSILAVTTVRASVVHPFGAAIAPFAHPFLAPAPVFPSPFLPAPIAPFASFLPAPVAPVLPAPVLPAPAIAPVLPPPAFGFAAPVFKPHYSFAYPAPVYKPHYHIGFASPVLKAHVAYPVVRSYAPFAPALKALPYSFHYHKTVIPPTLNFKSHFHGYAPGFAHSHLIG